MTFFQKLFKGIKKYGFFGLIKRVHYARKYSYDKLKNIDPNKYPMILEKNFKLKTGNKLDLTNPITLSEKIQWLKIYGVTEFKTMLSDKYLVRDWVKSKIGENYLIPLLGVWEKFDDIDFSILPTQFVLKTNHGSGWNLIVKNKDNLNFSKAKSDFDNWLKLNYAFKNLEMHYQNIKPLIIAEKYIENIDDLYDYKFVCFNGVIDFIWVDTERYTDHKRTLFDLNWKRIDAEIAYPKSTVEIKKPEKFSEMISIVSKLAADINYVRVDLYEVDGQIYFGEMTFTSGNGIEKVTPHSFDVRMGKKVMLHKK